LSIHARSCGSLLDYPGSWLLSFQVVDFASVVSDSWGP
jgi:hypothetical protein